MVIKQYVKTFEYLRHIITDTFSDDDDIHREIRNMFIRTNILTRCFAKCSVDVKIILFRTYVYVFMMQVCGLDIKLGFLTNCYHATISAYKMFFGFKHRDIVTKILFALNLPSFNTIMQGCLLQCYCQAF